MQVTRTRLLSLLVGLLALAAATTLAACGEDDDGGGGGGPGGKKTLNLTIGDLVPLTGDLSDFGPPGRKAADLAVEQIKDGAQQAGANHTVKVVHADEE